MFHLLDFISLNRICFKLIITPLELYGFYFVVCLCYLRKQLYDDLLIEHGIYIQCNCHTVFLITFSKDAIGLFGLLCQSIRFCYRLRPEMSISFVRLLCQSMRFCYRFRPEMSISLVRLLSQSMRFCFRLRPEMSITLVWVRRSRQVLSLCRHKLPVLR